MIRLRPHHGLCLQFFEGKGYSEGFVKNMSALASSFQKDPGQPILLTCGPDFVCTCCPHCTGGGCDSGQKVLCYDSQVLSFCGLKDGDILPWQEFSRQVREKILSAKCLEEVCRGCQWLELCSSKAAGQGPSSGCPL